MAHNLNFRDGKVSFLNATGKPAWHGFGTVLDNPATADEALLMAQLDFTVEKTPIFLSHGNKVPDHFATVRTDTRQVLGVVGSRYKVLQNTEAFSFFDPMVDRSEACYVTAGALGKGEKIWIMAKLPAHICIKGMDEIECYTTIMNSHDGSSAIQAFLHTEAIVCNNTLDVALRQGIKLNRFIGIKHTHSALEKLNEASRILGIHNLLVQELNEAFSLLANTPITARQEKEFVEAFLPTQQSGKQLRKPKNAVQREHLLAAIHTGTGQQLPARQGTAWGLFNGATYWIDHMKSYQEGKKLDSIWFGNSSRLRQRAFDMLLDFAADKKSISSKLVSLN